MSARVTLSDVASAVGVSSQTVSRVLNNHPSVRPATRARVMAAVEALGYEPNLAARSLAAGTSSATGILLTAGLDHGMAATFAALARAVREQGQDFVLATADGASPDSVNAALVHLRGYGVSSTIVLAQRSDVLAVLATQRNPGPVVAVISGDHDLSSVATVSIDQALGERRATEHLLSLGRRRLVHVSGDLSWQDASERLAAYQSVCAEAGVPDRWIATDSWTSAAGARVARRLLETGLPDAVVAANDDIALGVLHELLTAGVRVPDDVAIVGFDDIPQAQWTTPALTTVAQDFDALGRKALEIADGLASGLTPARCTLVPELIIRSSTASSPA